MPAFADAGADTGNAGLGLGGISGGFFSGYPMAPPNASMLTPAPQMGVLQANPGSDLCGPAVAAASAGHHLPPGLLNAIATVESGRLNPQTGVVKPWPWTIDANGNGYMYPTEQAAEQAAAGFEAAGITSLDLGCLQVNLAQHPNAFQSLAQAFDPAANANYAATFLTSLQQKFGNWPQAVAAYHSQTPSLGGPYEARVYAQWLGTAAPMALAAAGMPEAARTAPTPLPQTAFQMSALAPPMRMMMRLNNGMTGRSLASYRAAPVAIAIEPAPQG